MSRSAVGCEFNIVLDEDAGNVDPNKINVVWTDGKGKKNLIPQDDEEGWSYDDPENPSSAGRAQIAMLVGQLINLKFGRDDELESDFLGVCFMNDTGYNPQDMIQVMQVLASSRQGQSPPEFFSTHPNPESRVTRIQ